MSKQDIKIIGVIPARLESTRFPEKPLVKIAGREMILWVADAALKAANLSKVIVATDSDRIFDVVKKAGFDCEMTSKYCRSGSDRLCEVAAKTDGKIYVNIQGDEPLIEPALIDSVTKPFLNDPDISVTTAVTAIKDESEFKNPDCVKAVLDKKNFAMYFSRSPIPFFRSKKPQFENVYKHIGIYAYTRNALLDFANLSKSLCEEAESLEQLRFLENGYKIYCIKTQYVNKGVDTPGDLEEVLKILKDKREV
ncbi:MAG TPA: 3-deoxy-manno-octulosonate cytidylyltransferase [Candidatus Wallbacteria bacterium]|nr:3-deoxy-manno-octulosonate cytidylyltransferase [Candidatus Wallbacteria bacterium]